jgi:flagellar hook-length control protein FliK
MVLEPEHLGQLRLRIQLDRGEVTTNMVVDNQAVKELIMSRLNVLEESLLEHGFGLGSFEVGVKGENAEGDRSSTEAQGRKVSSTVNPVDNPIPVEGVREQYLPWISSRVNITV